MSLSIQPMNAQSPYTKEAWSASKAKHDIRDGKVFIYCCWGLPGVIGDSAVAIKARLEDACTEELTDKYGFQYVVTGTGCFKPIGVDSYNKVVYRYLRRRNGKDWKQSFDVDIEKCVAEKLEK